MAVRLASDTIRTLYAIQCITKDMKHRSHSPVCKNKTSEMRALENARRIATKSPTDSIQYDPSPAEQLKKNQKQRSSISNETALVHKVLPNDRQSMSNVQERAKCNELDDILAKWNVYKPKK